MQSWCFCIRYGVENGGCGGSLQGIFVSSLKCYQFGECFRQKEVISSTLVLKKDAILFYLLCSVLWQVIEFSVVALCFWLPTWIDWFVYFGCFAFINAEATVGKLKKLLYCEDVRLKVRAAVIEEAHLVVQWQVFDICVELFPFTTRFNIGRCQVNEFFSAIMLCEQRMWQIKFWTFFEIVNVCVDGFLCILNSSSQFSLLK